MKYILLKRATNDILEIRKYISERNSKASEKVILEFEKSFELIAEFPNIGVEFPEDDEILVYHLSKIPYSIPYMMYGGYIVIMRVFHQSQARMFNEEKPSKNIKDILKLID